MGVDTFRKLQDAGLIDKEALLASKPPASGTGLFVRVAGPELIGRLFGVAVLIPSAALERDSDGVDSRSRC